VLKSNSVLIICKYDNQERVTFEMANGTSLIIDVNFGVGDSDLPVMLPTRIDAQFGQCTSTGRCRTLEEGCNGRTSHSRRLGRS
jgi:hypothetical protein